VELYFLYLLCFHKMNKDHYGVEGVIDIQVLCFEWLQDRWYVESNWNTKCTVRSIVKQFYAFSPLFIHIIVHNRQLSVPGNINTNIE
jgi:hypothetical protein